MVSSATVFDTTLAALAPRLGPRWRLRAVAEVDSTNSALMQASRQQAEAQLLVAERQTAGRGRLGRHWASSAERSLTFSLSWPLRADTPLDGLSLAAGVVLVEALHPALRLKWPNDLWLEGRKLGGILIEAIPGSAVVIGVGLNLDAPADVDQPVAGLRELDTGWSAPLALAAVLPPLAALLESWQGFGADWQRRFAARDGLAGCAVQGDGVSGVAEGVDSAGLLRLRGQDGHLRLLRSGEARLRPEEACS